MALDTLQIPADDAVRFITMATNTSNASISKALGHARTYIGTILTKQHMPRLNTFCEIANACGFDVVLVRGNKQIIVTPSDESS